MKILLLIPPASLEKSYGKLKDFSNPQPSIGLAYIASVLKKNNFEVVAIDAYVNQFCLVDILDKIKKELPQIIGISVLSTSAGIVTQLVKEIRKLFPKIRIVMGNIHASLFDKELLKQNLADYIVYREGEYTFLELVQKLSKNQSIDDVMGISFLRNGKIISTGIRPFIEELDELPFPDWTIFPLSKYKTDPRTALIPGHGEMQILATRGCPNMCAFCSSHTDKSLGYKYRMRKPEKVVDELEYLNKKYGARAFSFMDLAFPLIKDHGMALCREIIKRKLNTKIKWTTETRVKPIDQEMLNMMKKAGCKKVNFGIESGNNEILKVLKKNFTTDDVRRAVDFTNKAGIEANGMFMIGLPGETKKEIMETINFALELKLRYAIFNIFVPYPGCEFYENLSKQGKIHFKDWSDFTSYPTYSGGEPVYVPDGLTKEKLMNLQKLAMKRFYLRPKFILNEIRHFKPHMIKKYWNGLFGLLKK
ncbi:B12-binding domain-containing radical SAM protein [Patescibacteria group bacterium]|nr:B12-binding domain-containing radical SAM protein [Patescibacteria group bacterium]